MSTLDIATPLSPEDLARAEHEAGVEFDGERLIEKGPMGYESSLAGARILTLVSMEAMRTKQGVVLGPDFAYRCFPDEPTKFRKPDISFIRAERLPADVRGLSMMPIAPDLAVEVISPTDLALNIDGKLEEYFAAGVGQVWIVNPDTRTIRVYRPDGTARTFRADDELTGEPFLPTFRCKVAAFFE